MKKQMHTTGKTTQEKAREERMIRVGGKAPWKRATGHHSHIGGAGSHQDKRCKRSRTRGDKLRKALKDQN